MNIRNILRGLCCLMAVILLTGCQASGPSVTEPVPTDDTHQIVYASFYPIYALSAMLLQDIPDMELRQLVQPQDGCLRNYQLSDWDLYQIVYNADAMIIGGRGLETFEDALQNLGDNGPAVATLFQNLTLNQNGIRSSDEDSGHLSDENPHLYMSVRALPVILESLYSYMAELDPMYESHYHENLQNALVQANLLIEEYDAATNTINRNISVALLNEALIYPANDLGLNVCCRIDRESGAHFYGSDLEQAIRMLEDNGTDVILIEKQAPDALVNALSNAGFDVVKLDILSTGREEMGAKGYFTTMHANLSAIVQALNNN